MVDSTTAKSVDEAKKSLWRNGLFLKPLGLLFPLLGLCLYTYFADVETQSFVSQYRCRVDPTGADNRPCGGNERCEQQYADRHQLCEQVDSLHTIQ